MTRMHLSAFRKYIRIFQKHRVLRRSGRKFYFIRLALVANTFLTTSLSINSLCHLFNVQPSVPSTAFGWYCITNFARAGYFSSMLMSGTNPFKTPAFHGMNERSAMVILSPTRYFCFESTLSSTPKTRLISLLYLSTALGTFSGWKCWNQADWPK